MSAIYVTHHEVDKLRARVDELERRISDGPAVPSPIQDTTKSCRLCQGESVQTWATPFGGPTHHTCHPGEERPTLESQRDRAENLAREQEKTINKLQDRLSQIGTIAANALDEWKHCPAGSSEVYGRLVGIRNLARKGTTDYGYP